MRVTGKLRECASLGLDTSGTDFRDSRHFPYVAVDVKEVDSWLKE